VTGAAPRCGWAVWPEGRGAVGDCRPEEEPSPEDGQSPACWARTVQGEERLEPGVHLCWKDLRKRGVGDRCVCKQDDVLPECTSAALFAAEEAESLLPDSISRFLKSQSPKI
jgi:hypothetical protein